MELFEVQQISEVMKVITSNFKAVGNIEYISIFDSVDRVLAENIIAKENVPSFNRSTVDGYAVKASNTYGSSEAMPTFFKIVGSVEMGENVEQVINDGEAMYVPTGGMVPIGADAMVMIEHVEIIGDLLNVYDQVAPNQDIIFKGEDTKIGDIILQKGHLLRPQDLGAMSSLGIFEVPVYSKIKVGIISTGDEIVPPDTEELLEGQIRDINGISVSGAIQANGGEAIYYGIVNDDYHKYLEKAKAAFKEVDFLILSGGSSMGKKDFTSQIMNDLGNPGVLVHGVSIKPGKPTLIANCDGKPVMGLPGHPVSALLLFEIFGKQIMNILTNTIANQFVKYLKARVTRNIPSQVGRTDFIRVKIEIIDDYLSAQPIFSKSGLITNLVKADGVIEIPQFSEGVVAGQEVNVLLF